MRAPVCHVRSQGSSSRDGELRPDEDDLRSDERDVSSGSQSDGEQVTM